MAFPFKIRFKPKPSDTEAKLPINGGRVSQEDTGGYTMRDLYNQVSIVDPDFQFQMIEVLEHLAMYNPDLSFAIENIVTLGNTDFTIEFDDNTPEKIKEEAIKELKVAMKEWYVYSDGTNALVNDLLAQVCVTGALSAEAIPKEDLTGIKKVVLVSPKEIRFRYDADKDIYTPYQAPKSAKIDNEMGLIRLNPYTYKYYAIRRLNNKPYAIPPFLSALDNIAIEKSMVEDLKNLTKKLGVLGFLKIMLNAPGRKPGESEEDYYTRCKNYLSDQRPEAEKSVKKGFVLGFKGNHEIEMENISANVQGAKDLFQLNTEMKMSGLKQDPSMLGRNYSTTETMGRVVLKKLATQIENYQKIVESFLSYTFKLHLQLKGIKVESVEVEFSRPMLGDRNTEEEAFGKKIDNAIKLYNQGIYSQEQVARYVGSEKADQLEPRQQMKVGGGTPPGKSDKKDAKNPDTQDDETDTASNWRIFVNDSFHYDYCLDDQCSCSSKITARKHVNQLMNSLRNPFNKDVNFESLLLGYMNKSLGIYDDAITASVKEAAKQISDFGDGVTLEQINDRIIYNLYKGWNTRYTQKQTKVTNAEVTKIYENFRRDKSIFEQFDNPKNLPEAVFNVTDRRTIEYYKNSDTLYLGKFITDPDTKQRITEFIKSEYIDKNLPIGSNKDPKSLEAFRSKFHDVLQGEDWKIVRIINTTVNKLRNYSAISYMDQALVEEFEIRGVVDRLQCDYCKQLQGTKFKVKTALGKIEKVISSEPELVEGDAPFINKVFKKPADMEGLSGEQIQDKNIDVPPYHPHCRDRVIAVFSDVETTGDTKINKLEIPQEFQNNGMTQEILDKLNSNDIGSMDEFDDFYKSQFPGKYSYDEVYNFSTALKNWVGNSNSIRKLPETDIRKRMINWYVENNRTLDTELTRGMKLEGLESYSNFEDIYNELKSQDTIKFGEKSKLFGTKEWDMRLNSFTNDESTSNSFMGGTGAGKYKLKTIVKNQNGVIGGRVGNLFKDSPGSGYSEYETIVGDNFEYKVIDVIIEPYEGQEGIITLILEQLEK